MRFSKCISSSKQRTYCRVFRVQGDFLKSLLETEMPIYCMWDHSLHPKIFQVVKMASISVITLNLTIIKFYVVKEVSKCIYRHTCKCAHKHTHIYGILKASYLLGVVFTILLVSKYNCCGRHYTTKVTMLV